MSGGYLCSSYMLLWSVQEQLYPFVYVVPRAAVANISELLCAHGLSRYKLRAPL